MPYQTDERLKSYLDTNQLHREQMCCAILAIDKRFSDVRPRHPRGGPDGGRDIEGIFRHDQRAFGAIGFVNQANDSDEQKRRVKSKFRDDLDKALTADPKLQVFVFFTNTNLNISEKDELNAHAREKGIAYSEIMDRERIRIVLDSADGFSIRFQYLQISLSDEEPASFFAKWGDDIQSVISNGFQNVGKVLDRLLFLLESSDTMSIFALTFELDRSYPAEEIGHFRALCYMHLREPKHRIFSVFFGSWDRSDRIHDDDESSRKRSPKPPGIKHSIGGAQWEQYIDVERTKINLFSDENNELKYERTGWVDAIGMDTVEFVTITYDKDSLLRLRPQLSVRDIDGASFMPFINKSFAEKISAIHVYAYPYKVLEIRNSEFAIDYEPFEADFPIVFDQEELADQWVRIRPKISSIFNISFAAQTPVRMFLYERTPDSLENRKRRASGEK